MQRSPSDPEPQRSYQPQQKDEHNHRHGLAYFLPGQVMLFAEHEPDREAGWIVDQVQRELNSLIGDEDRYQPPALRLLMAALRQLGSSCEDRPDAVLTFLPQKKSQRERQPRAFSSIAVELAEPRNQRPIADRSMIQLFDYLNRRIIARPRSRRALTLRAASPNWLASSAQPGITGGPGARPVPAPDVPPSGVLSSLVVQADPQKINMWEFALPFQRAQQGSQTARAGDSGVEVAILDTAPSIAAFEHARKLGLHQSHPLLSAMLQADGMPRRGPPDGADSVGKLSISYAATLGIGLQLPEPYFVDAHDYQMPDHGLFVAGIVNSIAPRAKLHLLEVLNARGVGTFQGLFQALQFLLNRSTSTRLVVNCSLMINMPLPGQPRKNLGWPALEMDCRLIGLLSWPAQRVYDLLRERADQDVRVVAAAGNDAEGRSRPQARLPAALDRVIGVGALGPDDRPAGYSNLADTPMRVGLATFGGAAANGVADARAGILGTYIGAFPPHGAAPAGAQPAPNGWARWAGTSFAAPVISGTLAMLVEQGVARDLAEAERMVRDAEPDRTDDGEEIFSVRQGVAQGASQGVPA